MTEQTSPSPADAARAKLAALVCADFLSHLGYEVFDACCLCVVKDIPDGCGGHVLLSGYDPTDKDGEPFVPCDLDAPAFYTLWDDAGATENERMHEHRTLRAALDEIEAICKSHRGNPDRAVAGEIGGSR